MYASLRSRPVLAAVRPSETPPPHPSRLLLRLLVALLLLNALGSWGAASDNVSFSYQGTLRKGNSLTSGNYEMHFSLYDAVEGGSPLAVFSTNLVSVASGLFRTELTFPIAAFDGQPKWLEIAVKPAGSASAPVTLVPRQAAGVAPTALYALQAANSESAARVAPGGLTLDALDPGLSSNLVWRAGSESGVVVDPAGRLLSGTNLFSANGALLQAEILKSAPLLTPTIPGLYYVATNGNDATALEGRIDRPWRSVSNAVAAARPVGATVRVLPGVYGVHGNRLVAHTDPSRAGVTISGKTNFVLEGIGYAAIHNLDVGDIVIVEESEAVTIRNLHIGYATKPAATNLYDGSPSLFGVVALRGFNKNITMQDLDIYNYPDHGLGTHHDTGFTDGVRILNVHSRHSGTFYSPIYVNSGDGNVVTVFNMANVEIDGLYAEDYFRGVEFFEYDSSEAGITNVVIHNSQFIRGSNLAVVVLSSPANHESFRDIRIDNCLIDGIENDGVTVPTYLPVGIVVGGSHGVRILNSEIKNVRFTSNPGGTEAFGVQLLGNVTEFELRNCKISRCGTGVTTYTEASPPLGTPRNLVFSGNRVELCVGHGMELSGVNVLVTDNTLANNGQVWMAAGIQWADVLFGSNVLSNSAIFDGNWVYNTSPGTRPGQTMGLWINSTNPVTLGQTFAGLNVPYPVYIDGSAQSVTHGGLVGTLPSKTQGNGQEITDTGGKPFNEGTLWPHQSMARGGGALYEARGSYSTSPSPGTIQFRLRASKDGIVFATGEMPLPANAGSLGWELKVHLRPDPVLLAEADLTGRADLDRGDGTLVSRIVPKGDLSSPLDLNADQTLVLEVVLNAAGNKVRLDAESIRDE